MKLSIEELKDVVASAKTSLEQYLALELIELKGDRVPVDINDDMAIAFHAATTDSALGRDDMEEIKAGLQAVQELFTDPQKPVVLPHGYKPYLVRSQTTAVRAAMTSGGDWMHRDEVTTAIEAAGGIVKDGE